MTMKWCSINEAYLTYLRSYEPKIPYSEYFKKNPDGTQKKLLKPFFFKLYENDNFIYVGQVNHFNYMKHNNMTEMLDFKKISLNGQPLCVVNLNYMFPVPKNEIKKLNYNNLSDLRDFDDDKDLSSYISLLSKEIKEINKRNLNLDAELVYKNKMNHPRNNLSLRSFNFCNLQRKCAEWTNNKLIGKINNKKKINKYEFYNLKDNNKLYTVNSEVNDGHFIATKTDPTNNQTNYILMKCENNELKNIKDITEFNNKDISNLKEFLKEENKGKFSVIDVVDNMMESQIKPNNKFEIEFTPRPNHTPKSCINKNKN